MCWSSVRHWIKRKFTIWKQYEAREIRNRKYEIKNGDIRNAQSSRKHEPKKYKQRIIITARGNRSQWWVIKLGK